VNIDAHATASGAPALDATSSSRLGPYRLLRVIGEGGMGVVYEAEQLAPVHRRVAIKMIRAGMQTGDVVARFEAERQALAVMDHPGIARVLEAGTAEDGRSYFVMELVKGVPLTEYCDTNRLTIRERVRLMIEVAHAVQHAHQKGVIHRDLKPSNVLVAEQNGPAPKIIDFGIAKALSQRLTERTLVTAFGQSMGTPAYMSPEQAEATGLDVDTRADVFSLGVVIYEVLVGRLPVDPDEVGYASFMLALTGRANDPPRPSVRVAQLGAAATGLAALRRTNLDGLRRQLRGDLDWIVGKSIEKDRARRYDSATALADDLQRYLAHEPIVARPPSAAYRMRKLVQRNRLATVAFGLVALSLIAGGSLATLGFVRSRRAEARARQEAQAAARTTDFLVGLFAVNSPDAPNRADSITVRQLLDSGAARIRRELGGQPAVQSRLLNTMGSVYMSLGLYDRAEPLLRESLETRRRTASTDSASVADAYFQLGKVLAQKGALAAAESAFQATHAIRERLADVSDSARAAELYELARIAFMRGEGALARGRAGQVLERLQSAGMSTSALAINARTLIGIGFAQQQSWDSAAVMFRDAIAMGERVLGTRNSTVLGAKNNLSIAERNLGHLAAAESLSLGMLPVVRELYGPKSDRYATVLINLDQVYVAQKRWADAERVIREAVDIERQVLDPQSLDLADALGRLAEVDAGLGHLQAADSLYRRVLAMHSRPAVPDSLRLRETLTSYAKVLKSLGRAAEADAMERRAASLAPVHKP
jgi:tetratricopeptide (TPR) repeat protein/predicted Ser/Thr protein kinase